MNRVLTAHNIFEPPGQNERVMWKTDSPFFFFRHKGYAKPMLRKN